VEILQLYEQCSGERAMETRDVRVAPLSVYCRHCIVTELERAQVKEC
jgi:hypothetical protein